MTDILTAIAKLQNGVQIPPERIARYQSLVEETNGIIARTASELISLSHHGVEARSRDPRSQSQSKS
jgi:hypothetical protein